MNGDACARALLPRRTVFTAALDAGVVGLEALEKWVRTGDPLQMNRIPFSPEQLVLSQALAKHIRSIGAPERAALQGEIQALRGDRQRQKDQMAKAKDETAKKVAPRLIQTISLPDLRVNAISGIVDIHGQAWVLANVSGNEQLFHLYRVGENKPVQIFELTEDLLSHFPQEKGWIPDTLSQLRLSSKGEVEVHILQATMETLGHFMATAKMPKLKFVRYKKLGEEHLNLVDWQGMPDGQEIVTMKDFRSNSRSTKIASLNGELNMTMSGLQWWQNSSGHLSFMSKPGWADEYLRTEWISGGPGRSKVPYFEPLAHSGGLFLWVLKDLKQIAWMDADQGESSMQVLNVPEGFPIWSPLPKHFFTNLYNERLVFIPGIGSAFLVNLTTKEISTLQFEKTNFESGELAEQNTVFSYGGRSFWAARAWPHGERPLISIFDIDNRMQVGRIELKSGDKIAWILSGPTPFFATSIPGGIEIYGLVSP